MNGTFRQSMAWLHTWTGLTLGWLLFFMFLTGTAGYFDTEIDRWMQPELPVARKAPIAHDAALGITRLQSSAPQAERWFVARPVDRTDLALRVGWQPAAGGRFQSELIDSTTGQPYAARKTGGGQLLFKMHFQLHYLPVTLAYWLVGIATMVMLVAIVSGVIVHRKIFADFFTFRPWRRQRSWLDAHNILAVTALPFHLMITYSGLIFFAYLYMAPVVAASYGFGEDNRRTYFDELNGRTTFVRAGTAAPLTPLAPLVAQASARWSDDGIHSIDVRHPGDAGARVLIRQTRSGLSQNSETLIFDGVSGALLETVPAFRSTPKAVQDVLLGLHEGLFAGTVLRWLYFLTGLAGTAMIGAGLVLWTVKRREKLKREGHAPFGLVLAERLNIGTITGLPIAIAAYFWANRLLPVTLEGRAAWEAHAMFIVWAALLLHPVFRPARRAWTEQLWLAAAACALLPLLNALTTDRHLGRSLPQGDWVMAGFDLTMLAFGLAFTCVAWALTRRTHGAPNAAHRPLKPYGSFRKTGTVE